MNSTWIRNLTVLFACVGLAACDGMPRAGNPPAGTVGIKLDFAGTLSAPFPSNKFSVADPGQITAMRVNLPRPDCRAEPDNCDDVTVLNRLDGFSLNPTATIPFDGAIDPATATSENIYFVELGDGTAGHASSRRIGIDRAIWNPARQILSVKPIVHLREHTRHALVVTSGVKGADGRPVRTSALQAYLGGAQDDPYRQQLAAAHRALGGAGANIAALSVFTTMSATAELVKIRAQMVQSPAPKVDFNVAQVGGQAKRAVFDAASLTQVSEVWHLSTKPTFATYNVDVRQLSLVPGSTSRVAFGQFSSPNYLTADRVIADLPTRSGVPAPVGQEKITFVLFLPSGPMPARGWPVAIYGHGYSDSNTQAAWAFSSVLPSMGIAVIGINAVGHGGGPLTRIELKTVDGTVASIAGNGRSVAMTDLPGTSNENFARYGGFNAIKVNSLIDVRDGVRQTAIDLMQLTRAITAGIDVDGAGRNTLDPERIYYCGASLGGVYGTVFAAMEPRVRAAELYVTGGPWPDLVRMGAIRDRPAQGYSLMFAARKPALTNVAGAPAVKYNENIPPKHAAPLTDTVVGAFELQQWFDRNEWAGQKANPVVYAPLLSRQTHGPARPVAILIANGDATVNNQVSDVLVHAGGWRRTTAMFRFDLLKQANPALPADPHRWQTGSVSGLQAHQILSQKQVGAFFASDGKSFVDPDGADPIFEVPALSLPFDGTR